MRNDRYFKTTSDLPPVHWSIELPAPLNIQPSDLITTVRYNGRPQLKIDGDWIVGRPMNS